MTRAWLPRTSLTLLLLALSAGLGCTPGDEGDPRPSGPTDPRKLHVPSPDWSKQVIYFVLTDRFSDGDPKNDDQGYDEFDPADQRKYSGGDLKGVIDRLDYIQALGATAVWITPPVANQWWDPLAQFGGYHGYWARDPEAVDEHMGTLDDYMNLSNALHARGMYLIQDVVPNHMGNFFTYTGAYDPAAPEIGWTPNLDARPTPRPTRAPYDLNDPTNATDLATGIYHFTPPISDYNDAVQEKTYQVSDLDDLATENPLVRQALKRSYGYWIRQVGVDGFRIDTAKFVEPDFWNAFLHDSGDGMHAVAEQTGRSGFLAFGEVFETSGPADTTAEQKIRQHLGTASAPGLDAALGFPLYGSIIRVLAEGQPTDELAFRMQKMMDRSLVRDPYVTPIFLDNHDVARFVSRAGRDGLRQGLRMIFTLPGIPVVYQGTEHSFSETRASMFKEGWGSDGLDHFDTTDDDFKALRALADLRASSPVFTKGDLRVLASSPAGPGVLAYARTFGDEKVIVVFNTSAGNALVAHLDAGLQPGQRLTKLLGEVAADTLNADAQGQLSFELHGRASAIFRVEAATDPVVQPSVSVSLDAPPPAVLDHPWRLSGHVTGGAPRVKVVIDDLLDSALEVFAVQGTFTATLTLDRFDIGDSRHSVTIYAPDARVAGPRYTFTVRRVFDGVRVDVADPMDDDRGPTGTYRYPTDATFSHQEDILGLTIEAGSSLALTFHMREISTSWRPQNGFDHVAFSVFFELPGQTGGTDVMPLLSARTPSGFTWTRNHFAFGWANNLRSAQGADATTDGEPIAGAPVIKVSEHARTIQFTYPKAAFGVSDWTGVRIYASTWDFDGIDNRYRPITPDGGQWVFGGGAEDSAKIMDEIGPITIPPKP